MLEYLKQEYSTKVEVATANNSLDRSRYTPLELKKLEILEEAVEKALNSVKYKMTNSSVSPNQFIIVIDDDKFSFKHWISLREELSRAKLSPERTLKLDHSMVKGPVGFVFIVSYSER